MREYRTLRGTKTVSDWFQKATNINLLERSAKLVCATMALYVAHAQYLDTRYRYKRVSTMPFVTYYFFQFPFSNIGERNTGLNTRPNAGRTCQHRFLPI